MSWVPHSTTPEPSLRTTARASAMNINAGKIAVPTPQPAVLVAHRSRFKRTPRPAKPLGALRVAFAQRLGREWLAGDRLDLGVILEPERQRVHPARPRRLVDRILQRHRARRLAGRAHEHRCPRIDAHGFV